MSSIDATCYSLFGSLLINIMAQINENKNELSIALISGRIGPVRLMKKHDLISIKRCAEVKNGKSVRCAIAKSLITGWHSIGTNKSRGCKLQPLDIPGYIWCRRPDLNRHGSPHRPLKTACLPIPPRRHLFDFFASRKLWLRFREGLIYPTKPRCARGVIWFWHPARKARAEPGQLPAWGPGPVWPARS